MNSLVQEWSMFIAGAESMSSPFALQLDDRYVIFTKDWVYTFFCVPC